MRKERDDEMFKFEKMKGGLDGFDIGYINTRGGRNDLAPAMTSPMFTALPAARPAMTASMFLIVGFIILLAGYAARKCFPIANFKKPFV